MKIKDLTPCCMSDRTVHIVRCEEAFMVLKLDNTLIRLYWTPRAGLYGHQVVATVFQSHVLVMEYRTTGCGYSKDDAALTHLFQVLGVRVRNVPKNNEHCGMWKYTKGGNFYSVPKRDILKYKRG